MDLSEKKKLLTEYGLDYVDDGQVCQICITGMMMAPIRLAGKLFSIDAFLGGISGRPYNVSLSYGEEITFYIKEDNGGWKAVTEEIWNECISGLTEDGIVESLFEAKVECPSELLRNADVWLKSLEEDKDVRKWEDAFWQTDRWCLALSATKLLNATEKAFCSKIKEYYSEEDYSFYLGEMEQILTEEDKKYIESSMDAFAGQFPDGIRVGYQADEVRVNLFGGCVETEAVQKRREACKTLLRFSKLKEVLQKSLEDISVQIRKQGETIDRLQLLRTHIGQMENDFCRQIRIYHLRELQQKIHCNLEKFDVSLQQKLAGYVSEELNLSKLAEDIAPFLIREWEIYLNGAFTEWIARETDLLNQKLWEEWKQRVVELMSQNENLKLDSDIVDDLREIAEAIHLTDSLPDIPDSVTRQNKGLLDNEALPIVFIAAGAVAGIAGALLPGLAFAAIGVKSKMNQEEEKEQFRKEILDHALLQERQLLKRTKEDVDAEMKGMDSKINQWIHMQFIRISDAVKAYCGKLTLQRNTLLSEKEDIEAKI